MSVSVPGIGRRVREDRELAAILDRISTPCPADYDRFQKTHSLTSPALEPAGIGGGGDPGAAGPPSGAGGGAGRVRSSGGGCGFRRSPEELRQFLWIGEAGKIQWGLLEDLEVVQESEGEQLAGEAPGPLPLRPLE